MSGLYVHIPFCHAKCYYCDFFSMPSKGKVADVVDALIREWQCRAHEIEDSPETVYIGGGTPSILDLKDFRRLVGGLNVGDDVEEFTIEVNPEDVSDERCAAWRDCGVNRVSMGIQSFDDDQLKSIGRRHSAQEAIDAALTLKRHFDNVSLDLIYGLPGQDLASWNRSLDKMMELSPQHFSAYCLSYEPGTRLHAMLQAGKIEETDEDTIAAMYDALSASARKHGFEHYEISNFARQGYRSRHNSSYWLGTPYLGLGPGAHSFDGVTRRFNPSNLKKYLEGIAERGAAFVVDEEDDRDRLNDYIFTWLRTLEGIDKSRMSAGQLAALMRRAAGLQEGDLEITDHRISIPESRWLRSDAIIRELLDVD